MVAEHGRNLLSTEEGLDKAKMQLIYNGIDGRVFDRRNYEGLGLAIRAELGIESNQKVIGVVGRLAPIKNHALLLEAMRSVIECFPRTVLLLVGDGPLKPAVQKTIGELGLEQSVKLLGARTDIPRLLSIMDIFVLPSLSEGLSLTLIEACAAGLPIVATEVGGNPEVVGHGDNGLIVPSNDPEALAAAVSYLLKNEDTAMEMGAKGRQRFAKNFTVQTMVEKYQALYISCERR